MKLTAFCLLSVLLALSLPFVTFAAGAPSGLRWVKGNLHTHTLNSDGAQTPMVVARWYRENGFNFLFITDHNFRTELQPESLNAVSAPDFLVIPGEELTGSFNIHANVFGTRKTLYDSTEFIHPFLYLRHELDLAKAVGTLVSVNHPVWRFGVSTQDLMSLSGVTHFELNNGGPDGDNKGDSLHPSTEKMWDSLLSAGKHLFALTGDDSHSLDPKEGTSGKSFVMVRVKALTPKEVLDALRAGRCYGSSGALFRSIDTAGRILKVTAEKPGLIEFIGTNGRVLKSVRASEAELPFDTSEVYVRARLTNDDKLQAWTQPVYLKRVDVATTAEKEMDRFLPALMEAENLYRKGRLDDALNKYSEARKKVSPKNPYADGMTAVMAVRMGRILESKGKKEEALKEFSAVLEKSSFDIHRFMAAKEIFALTGNRPADPKLAFVSCAAALLKKGEAPLIDGVGTDSAWQAGPWIPFTAFKKDLADSVFFKVRYDAANLYFLVKALFSDTSGLSALDPLANEGLGFYADPDRMGNAVVSADNSTRGITAKSRVNAAGRFFVSEYKIPLKLFSSKPVKPGDLWGFNLARTYGKLDPGGWRTVFTKSKHTGWSVRGGDATRAPYLGLLRFE